MTSPQNRGVLGDGQRHSGGVELDRERCVELVIPAHPELWGLARMAVASVATKLAFDLEQIEDLRLAVDELCIACALGGKPSSVLRLACYWSEAGIYLDCVVSLVGPGNDNFSDESLPKGLSQKELSESILAALVDAHGISPVEDGSRSGWLRKDA
jgi:hypothetical protein